MRNSICLGLISLFLLSACGTYRYQRDADMIRQGLLSTYMERTVFLDVWGPPDKTISMRGEAIRAKGFHWFGAGGAEYSSERVYDVWDYQKRGVTLFFDGYYLLSWQTDKTTEELRGQASARPESHSSTVIK